MNFNKLFKNIIFSIRSRKNYYNYTINGWYLTAKGFFCGYYLEPEFRASFISNISIGENVVIQRRGVFSLGQDAKIKIGESTRIGSDCVFAAKKSIVIGSNVLIAARLFITDHNHEFKEHAIPIMKQGYTEPRQVMIGDNCWIGISVSILPGVILGRGCVVGANSVVTKSFPDYSIIFGSPARRI
jgi:abequosyltransferase